MKDILTLKSIFGEAKQPLVNLGYPEVVASIFHELFGKNAFLLGKWFKEFYLTKAAGSWEKAAFGSIPSWREQNIAINDLMKLYNANTKEDYNKAKKELGLYVDPNEDFNVSKNKKFIRDVIKDTLLEDPFFQSGDTSLVSNILNKNITDLKPYQHLSFQEAKDRYDNIRIFDKKQIVKTYKNGWKWINVGSSCQLVGGLMKNCGSAGVMSYDPDKTIITLFDKNNKPHVLVTYSPNDNRISGDEGPAGSAVKDKYHPYILDLAQTLNATFDAERSKSKSLKIRAIVGDKLKSLTTIKTNVGPREYSTGYFLLTLNNGKQYYSDGYVLIEKEEADNIIKNLHEEEGISKEMAFGELFKRHTVPANRIRLSKIALQTERKQKHKIKTEAGYAGGPSSVYGAATFRGGPYGFGGVEQLAAGLAEPVKKLKKQRDKEAVFNIEDQMRINRGYPAPQSVTGFPGGESNSGIRSGQHFPNEVEPIAISAKDIEDAEVYNNTKDYWGFEDSDNWEEDILDFDYDIENIVEDEFIEKLPEPLKHYEYLDDKLEEISLNEFGTAGAQGPMRGVPSDANYRDLPGFPRHNTIEKPSRFLPQVNGDIDNDGEEDVYLSDEEYVNDVLRLNGIDIRPGHMKKLFGTENLDEVALHERTLYHGTIIDHKDSIEKYGLTGELGDWVKDAYGVELDEEEWEEKLGEITFAAQKDEINKAVGAMRYHIGKKLGKWLTEVTIDDIRRWGMLVIIKDVEEGEYDDDWQRRPEHGKEGYYDEYPISTEPGDWFIRGGSHVDQILTGSKLINFLRRLGAFENMVLANEEQLKDMRRKLIKLAVAFHGPDRREKIVKIVKDLAPQEIKKQLENYRNSTNVSEAKRHSIPTNTLSLKKIFPEAYIAPPYGPEPDRGTERYKQGEWNEVPQGDDWLINPVDYSEGHTGIEPAEHSPGAQAYGQIGKPKDFVPEDWEQRHWKTKEFDKSDIMTNEVKELIQSLVKATVKETPVVSAKKLIKKLKKNKDPGCEHLRQKGSHAVYQCGLCKTVVPIHGAKDIKRGTVHSIEKDLEPCLGDDWLSEASKNIPTDKTLWQRALAAAKRKYDVYPSAYANAFASKWYKQHGGKWKKKRSSKNEATEIMIQQMVAEELAEVYKDSGLGKWFGEKWVDISRKDDKGGHPPCGASAKKGKRKGDSSKAYPKCVKKSTAKSMSSKEKKSAVRRKRAKPNEPGKPDWTKTKKEAYTGIDGDETGQPQGGSVAFEKNRKKILDDM